MSRRQLVFLTKYEHLICWLLQSSLWLTTACWHGNSVVFSPQCLWAGPSFPNTTKCLPHRVAMLLAHTTPYNCCKKNQCHCHLAFDGVSVTAKMAVAFWCRLYYCMHKVSGVPQQQYMQGIKQMIWGQGAAKSHFRHQQWLWRQQRLEILPCPVRCFMLARSYV